MNQPIYIGQRDTWGGEPALFELGLSDHRYHVYIIGKTGVGKTTLIRNLIVQHIAAGHGVGLIDPHGDLADELLDHIPPWRADHLVHFNPGDLDFPVGLNLLANVSPDERHLVASGIISAFKSIWRDSWGPRLEYRGCEVIVKQTVEPFSEKKRCENAPCDDGGVFSGV